MEIDKTTSQPVNYFIAQAKKEQQEKEAASYSVKDSVSIGSSSALKSPWMKDWTFMHYSAGDNNLKEFIVTDVNEMETVGSTSQMNLIVQLDTGENCKRFYLERDDDPKEIRSKVLEDMGPVNMSDPKVLGEFIKNSMEKYPAKHYALIISDHGLAWKGVAEDESHEGWMTMPMVRQGIEEGLKDSGRKIDVVGFDACLMANTEVATELSGVANYMVGSQQTEAGTGWAYTPLLNPDNLAQMKEALEKRVSISPKLLARAMVETAKADQKALPTLSAIDLSKMDTVTNASNNFAQLLLDTDTSGALLQSLARDTENFHGFKDQYHYAENILNSKDVTDEKLKEGAKDLMKTLEGVVIAEQHSEEKHPNAHGLTAEIPSYSKAGKGYENLKFAQETVWGKAMEKIAKGAKAQGATAQVFEIPAIKAYMSEGFKELGEMTGIPMLTDMAKDKDYANFMGKIVKNAPGFEFMANEPDFALQKGLGISGLTTLLGFKGKIDLAGSPEKAKLQSMMFVNQMVEEGQFGGIRADLFMMVVEAVQQAAMAERLGDGMVPPQEGQAQAQPQPQAVSITTTDKESKKVMDMIDRFNPSDNKKMEEMLARMGE
jgi:hypothetical protein